MQITAESVVSIEYTLKDDDGDVLDASEPGEPLSYLHGAENIVAGLEAALEGKTVGDAFAIRVEPAEAYGEYDETLVAEIERDRFPDGDTLELGDEFEANTPDGPQLVTVIGVDGDAITIDANHPLAGEALNFEVKVVGIRPATAQELAHGHVHGPGGHDHD